MTKFRGQRAAFGKPGIEPRWTLNLPVKAISAGIAGLGCEMRAKNSERYD
jgi:hypothetical protein